jgi:hypothetical protein
MEFITSMKSFMIHAPEGELTVACTINILLSSNEAPWIIIDDSREMLQTGASLTDNSRGVIYDPRGVIYTHL